MKQNGAQTRLLLVSDAPALRDAASCAAARLNATLDVMPRLDDALTWLLLPEHLCTHVLAPAALPPPRLEALASMVDEVTSRQTPLLLLGADACRSEGGSVTALPAPTAEAIETAVRGYHPAPPNPPGLTEGAFSAALYGGRLRMRLQPVVDAATLAPIGVEALARLHHPDLGILHPRHFLPVAERAGLERVVTAIAAAATIVHLSRASALVGGYLAINISLTTLCHETSVPRGLEICAAAGLRPSQVMIEVLETDQEPALGTLGRAVERWREAGFAVSIDDAGPRLPHWEKLLDLPFCTVKLDGMLATGPRRHEELAARIVEAANRRGMNVIGEGVEDEAAFERLRRLGVHALQGYLFCRPLPARALPLWVKAWQARQLPRPDSAPS